MNVQMYFENFLTNVGGFLPGVLGSVLILIIGWFIAKMISGFFGRLVSKTGLQERAKLDPNSINLATTVKKLTYYILMTIVLLVVLETMGISDVLDPLKEMVNKFLAFIPNIVAAGIIGFAGYVIASIASELIGVASSAVEGLSQKLGMGDLNITKLIKQLAFLIVFIPILVAAIDALKIDAISGPAKMMLGELIGAIPNIIAAVLILTIFYIGGKYITQILAQLLRNLGADELPAKLKISSLMGGQTLSSLAANVAFFFIVFTGLITAVEKLEFVKLTNILRDIFAITGQLAFGLLILAIGNFIANIAYDALSRSTDGAFLASIARFAILGLFLAISLRTMGIANDIVNLAFGLTLGSVAVAVALAFGLGGREAAGRQMEYILKKFRKED